MRKRYLDEQAGPVMGNVWTDVPQLRANGAERLGYPTQKPLALLERIVAASSNPGDMVLDPFCGCGTTMAAAEKLGRRWQGIDVTHLAINLMTKRLRDAYALEPGRDYRVIGERASVDGAAELAASDPNVRTGTEGVHIAPLRARALTLELTQARGQGRQNRPAEPPGGTPAASRSN